MIVSVRLAEKSLRTVIPLVEMGLAVVEKNSGRTYRPVLPLLLLRLAVLSVILPHRDSCESSDNPSYREGENP